MKLTKATIHNMSRFEKRKKIQKFLYNPAAVVVLGCIVLFLGFSVFSVFQKRHEAFVNAKNAEYELTSLRQTEARIQAQIDRLETESGIEEAIRNKYRAAKEGEGLVVITDDTRATPIVAPNIVQPKKTFWQTITSLVKGE